VRGKKGAVRGRERVETQIKSLDIHQRVHIKGEDSNVFTSKKVEEDGKTVKKKFEIANQPISQ